MAIERQRVIDTLVQQGIGVHSGKMSPDSIILEKRFQITESALYKQGLIEIQDEGSQIISYAANPETGMRILDACAGAGGKSLHLAILQNDSGEIIATDTEFNRLKEIKYRATRCGLKSIDTILLNKTVLDTGIEKKYKREFDRQFDIVLVDAPCSGTGTMRRSPLLKYNLTQQSVRKLADNQFKILSFYSQFVKPGGVLVYSTCSILPEENDEVIENFLELNDEFKPDSVIDSLKLNNINIQSIEESNYKLHLFPSLNGCDGFFMARLRKVSEFY